MEPTSCVCDLVFGSSHNCCDAGTGFLCQMLSNDFSNVSFRLNGREIDSDRAIDFATRILTHADSPLISGIGYLGTKSQQLSLDLARSSGAILDSEYDSRNRSLAFSLTRVGNVTATLGEVAKRSELVVVFDCDPRATHLRVFDQLPSNAKLIVIGSDKRSATIDVANEWLIVSKPDLENLILLAESVVAGSRINDSANNIDFESNGGAKDLTSAVGGLITGIKEVDYATFICSGSSDGPSEFHSLSDSFVSLIQRLNSFTRCVSLNLPCNNNGIGAENVSAWSTGYPFAINFSEDVPISFGNEYCTSNMLERGECDAAMLFLLGDDSEQSLSPMARKHLISIPQIRIVLDENRGNKNVIHESEKDVLQIVNLCPFPDDFVRFDDAMFTVDPSNNFSSESSGFPLSRFLSGLIDCITKNS